MPAHQTMQSEQREERKASVLEMLHQLYKYVAFGALCSASDTLLFFGFTSGWHVNPLIANVISTSVGVTMSFFFNRRYTFKVHDHAIRRYVAFFSIGVLGLGCSELILLIGGNLFPDLAPVYVKLLAVALVGLFQFFLNRNISFRTVVGAQHDDDDIV